MVAAEAYPENLVHRLIFLFLIIGTALDCILVLFNNAHHFYIYYAVFSVTLLKEQLRNGYPDEEVTIVLLPLTDNQSSFPFNYCSGHCAGAWVFQPDEQDVPLQQQNLHDLYWVMMMKLKNLNLLQSSPTACCMGYNYNFQSIHAFSDTGSHHQETIWYPTKCACVWDGISQKCACVWYGIPPNVYVCDMVSHENVRVCKMVSHKSVHVCEMVSHQDMQACFTLYRKIICSFFSQYH